jgi:hypothetical protein
MINTLQKEHLPPAARQELMVEVFNFLVLVVVYYLLTIVAACRSHRDAAAVAVLCR